MVTVASVTNVRYVDDLDGSDASGPVEFGIDGKQFEIDLSDENASKLRDVLAPFVAAARRVSGGTRRTTSSPARSAGSGRSREELAEARSWLRANGYKVADRGRLSNELLAAWDSKNTTQHGTEGNDQPQNEDLVEEKPKKTREKSNVVEFSGARASSD